MQTKNLYVKAVTILSVFLCMLFVVIFIEGALDSLFFSDKQQPIVKTEWVCPVETSEIEKKLNSARKAFKHDGSFFFIQETGSPPNEKLEQEIYDENYNLLWEGNRDEVPLQYQTLRYDKKNLGINNSNIYSNLDIGMKRYRNLDLKSNDGSYEYWRYWDGYFEIFKNGDREGFFAVNGFKKNKNELVKFDDPRWLYTYTKNDPGIVYSFWQSNNNLYFIDTANRSCRLVYQNIGKNVSIYLQARSEKYQNGAGAGFISLEWSERNPVIISLENFEATEIQGIDIDAYWHYWYISSATDSSIESEYKNYIVATYTKEAPERSASQETINQWLEEIRSKPTTSIYRLYGLRESGHAVLVREKQITRFPWQIKNADKPKMGYFERMKSHITDFSPVVLSYLYKHLRFNVRPESELEMNLRSAATHFMPYHVWVAWVLGGICAAVVYLHGRNRIQSKAALIGWVLFALLFNVAGMLTCLALTHYNLVKCENCGKKRHLLREKCLHCKKEMPAPASLATDIICGNR